MANATPDAEKVSREIEMRIVLENGATVPMPCTLTYTVHDPYAVIATFRSMEASVTWVFSRELLDAGTRRPAGDGDIRISPLHTATRSQIRIELSSPDGAAVMVGPLAPVAEFLQASFDLLPEGFEWQHMNIDRALAAILSTETS